MGDRQGTDSGHMSPLGINPQHDAGKFGNFPLARYWAAHSWKWHMFSVRDACRNHSEMDIQDTMETGNQAELNGLVDVQSSNR